MKFDKKSVCIRGHHNGPYGESERINTRVKRHSLPDRSYLAVGMADRISLSWSATYTLACTILFLMQTTFEATRIMANDHDNAIDVPSFAIEYAGMFLLYIGFLVIYRNELLMAQVFWGGVTLYTAGYGVFALGYFLQWSDGMSTKLDSNLTWL